MASLAPQDKPLLNIATQAPPPSKDYCQLIVEHDKVIFRWWKVSLKKDWKSVSPGEIKDNFEDFEDDNKLHAEIHRVFGKNTLEYVKGLIEGHIDYLPRLENPLLLKIIRFLPLEDITRLGLVSKQFRELCFSDSLWEQIYRDHSETPVTEELRTLADAIGWKKLFYTNKLQIQVQLSRLSSLKTVEHFDQLPVNRRRSLITETDLDINFGNDPKARPRRPVKKSSSSEQGKK